MRGRLRDLTGQRLYRTWTTYTAEFSKENADCREL